MIGGIVLAFAAAFCAAWISLVVRQDRRERATLADVLARGGVDCQNCRIWRVLFGVGRVPSGVDTSQVCNSCCGVGAVLPEPASEGGLR